MVKFLYYEKSSQMYYIGEIDLDMFKAISSEIKTREVIITEDRIKHIMERRGLEFYNKFAEEFKNIIENPDYIFKDSRANTALICKKFYKENKYINIVLKIVVTSENPEYKNSIITAIGESEKRFLQRLRNNELIYQRE